MTEETAQQIYEEGKAEHEKAKHAGNYAECDEWVCIAYKARARQLQEEDNVD